ncbi:MULTISPECIES: hypothetical protein [unclassified Oceanispirochaeta]|uniref:hypothetical protein n=1 Tax=unclassified Oceanispirochaeta TaxID=2635722 RepID=UPI000E0923D8|nr:MULTISPECIES: hypothetical protein [unclassified Oceanispirochaeta]MBF9016104.1 hypothetical protein [Oceanispirochaeta sp. M2]NPD72567.1 hypothetical protein [Oceanispirochaeta sp. M1]RDG32022.1 hypothetical protein DV872_10700 [Oceanispirochaeta sp. M1]
MTKKIKTPKAPKENKYSFKKSFKRFKNSLSFLIILVFAGFVFYTGWIQIRIPEGSHALIYTKTRGYDDALIAPGQFVWRWENLFPTNMTLHFLELNTQKEEYSLKSYLPSGRMYGEYIKHPETFEYSIALEYRFTLKETAFSRLVESGGFKSDSLEKIYSEYRTSSNSLIDTYLGGEGDLKRLENMEKDLLALLTDSDSSFTVSDLRIKSYSYPDTALYEKSRTLFLEELDTLRELEFKAEQVSSQIENSTIRKMDLLRQYGEVFSEYPVLLQYFDLDRDKLDPSLLKETEADS